MHKIFILLLALSCQAVYASPFGSLKEKAKESVFGEIASWFASLPGIKYLENKIDSNKVRIITSDSNSPTLSITAKEESELFIRPINSNASLLIYDKLSIPAGSYFIHASQVKKKGKGQTVSRRINLPNGVNHHEQIVYWKDHIKQYPLLIDTHPQAQRIRVMNIKAKYSHGMMLDSGRYDIEVLFKGDKKRHRFYVNLDQNQQTFSVYH
ncbi:hypothetical protein C9I98_19590 [Photobacterium sanctipauli]|uniref:Uncharacterized protein n=1 Tax=Photobacterium sanctipauli TaxID=1342794 RepID=A0A2T3NNC4_9GAMM|nr:hypothetical protein [Photobacterium sanctipauli]PSW17212.1 hypothetical protein C9I98_19590 [Photobacterium sanctipauli]